MQFQKYGKSGFPWFRQNIGIHKLFKFMDFLNISGEADLHTITKIWEIWIPMIQGKYGKKQTFQSYGFLKYFGWSRNPYNSQNMGKVNSHSKEKIWENTNISKLRVSEIFRLMQKSMQFSKHGKIGFPLYGKSMGKNKHSKVMGFSTILSEAEIHTIPKIWKKWIPIVRGKYEKAQTFQSNGFLKYFGWSRNPCKSQNMEKVNSHSKGKIWENTNIPK